MGWREVDFIGKQVGIGAEDHRRLCAACEHVIYRRLNQGHTWTSVKEVRKCLSALVGENLAISAVDACLDNRGALYNNEGIQPVGAAIMEQFVLKQSLYCDPQQGDLFDQLKMSDENVVNYIREIESQQGFEFSKMQVTAIKSALANRFNIIAGFAGSGKTSVLRAVVKLAELSGLKLHMMALSGRAAKRLNEVTGYASSTIARFTREYAGKELEYANLILVDEASMVDLSDLYRILRIGVNARVCLIGDPAQLPPIGFGAPFSNLVEYPGVKIVILEKVHRQNEKTGIPAIAKNIRNGISGQLEPYSGMKDGVHYLEVSEKDAPRAIVEIGKTFVRAGCEKEDMQIIAPIKRGHGGVNNLNMFMSSLLPNRSFMVGSAAVRVGDPIVYLRPDQRRDLRNGSLGRLIKPNLAEFEGREVWLNVDDAKNIDLAYCLTVHKSQGSQWDRVIVPLFNLRKNSFVERSLIYTAITRAAKQVVVVGDHDAYTSAVCSETTANRRQSGLVAHG
jgi:exodeoxyribonuclease V alpha subunit